MAEDKVFQKQLEEFGTEFTRAAKPPAPMSKKAREAQRRAFVTKEVVSKLMDTIQGREWIFGYLDECQVFSTTFVAGKPDLSDYLSGVQAVGHKLLADIMAVCPEKFYQMNLEASQRRLNIEVAPDEYSLV